MSRPASLISFEIQRLTRSGSALLFGLIFQTLFLSLCSLLLQGEAVELQIYAALAWLALFFSLLLSATNLFQEDFTDGTLTQLHLSGVSMTAYVLTKAIVNWVAFTLPALALSAAFAVSVQMSGTAMGKLLAGLALGSPALAAYAVLMAALFARYANAGLAGILIIVPFGLPVLLFGVSTLDVEAGTLPLQILAGLSLLSCGIALPAAIYATHINREP